VVVYAGVTDDTTCPASELRGGVEREQAVRAELEGEGGEHGAGVLPGVDAVEVGEGDRGGLLLTGVEERHLGGVRGGDRGDRDTDDAWAFVRRGDGDRCTGRNPTPPTW
jgi:hypothetical protein